MPQDSHNARAATQVVVRHALRRGFLTGEQLREALHTQEQLADSGRQADLLAVLRARFLRPEHLPELAQVYEEAIGSPQFDSRPTGHAQALPRLASEIPKEILEQSGEAVRRPREADPERVKAFLRASGEGDVAPTLRAEPPTLRDDSHLDASLVSDRQRRIPAPAQQQQIGDYRLICELARGAYGIVYRAHSLKLDRPVALKLLRDQDMATLEDVERFQLEARAAARLRHPNIVGIHDVDRDARGRHYLVMDLIEGETLRARLQREGPLDDREAAALAQHLSEALYYAHSQQILHRDLKPANVLLNRNGEPLITDFGLAKDVGDARDGLTATGQAMGTPSYMPPEQARGDLDRIDRRSDVYSLGATLYEMLTGKPPFREGTAIATMQAVVSEEPPAPRSLRPEIDRDLETICLRCLEKEPTARYGSAKLLAEDLARFLAGEPIAARPISPLERVARWFKRNRVVASAGLAVVAITTMIGVGAYFWKAGIEQERAAQETRRLQALRDEVGGLIDGIERGEVADNEDLRRVYYDLIRHTDPEATALMIERLDAISSALLAVSQDTYAEAKDLTEEERAAGHEPLPGLPAALEARAKLRPGDVLDASSSETLKKAGTVVEQREYARFRAALAKRRVRIQELIASRQQGTLGDRLSAARILCHVLGRLGRQDAVIEALARYLKAEVDSSRAIPAGLALSQQGGARAQELLLWARDVHGKKSDFWRSVKGGLKAIDEDVELSLESPAGHIYRAEAYWDKGEHQACADSASRAIELAPDTARAWALRAHARWRLKDYRGALEDSNEAVRLDTTSRLGWIVQGAAHQELGNKEAALDAFSQGITHNPEGDWGWRMRADVRHQLRQWREALTDASRAIELRSDDWRNWHTRGKIFHALGRQEEAERDFLRSVDLGDESYVARLNLSTARWALGKHKLAEADANRALELAAGSPRDVAHVLTNRAVLFQTLGNFEAALADLNAAIEKDPKAAAAYAARGGMRGMLGQDEAGVVDLDKALALDPSLSEAWLNRGLLRSKLGDDAAALEDISKAIQIKPDLAHAYSQRATIRASLGDLEGAARDFEAAIRLKPGDVNVWFAVGMFYARFGDLENAIKTFTRGLTIQPDHLQLLARRGDAYYRQGANEQALADYSAAIKADPRNAELLNKRGKANAELGELPAALDDYDASLKLDPKNPITWLSRASVRHGLGNVEGAMSDLDQATTLAPHDPDTWRSRALLLTSWNEHDKALEAIGRALALGGGKDASLWLYRGELRQRAGKLEGAIVDFERFLKLRPDSSAAEDVRARLKELKAKRRAGS